MRTKILLITIAAICLTVSSPVLATVLKVPLEYPTIQEAIDAAQPGDTVILSKGIYKGTGNKNLDFDGKAITVQSTNPEDPCVVASTVIDCENSGRGFYFHSGEDANSILIGLTIRNGYESHGAGIRIAGCTPTIHSCIIRDNHAIGDGGGINLSGNPTISNCMIMNNTADDDGGGIYCGLSQNPTIKNCVIVGNSCTGRLGDGGGIYCYSSGVNIIHCTIVANTTNTSGTTYGGGIFDGWKDNIKHCIVWANSSRYGSQIWTLGTNVSYCNVQGGYSGIGNIASDPCFTNITLGDYHLSALSLCIDSGDPCYNPAPGETDIDGDPRVIMDGVDIGADEFLPQTPIISTAPIDLDFFSYIGGPNPESQVVSIRNKGIWTLNWEIMESCSWLSAKPNSGCSAGEANDVTLSVDIAGLVTGAYTCNLTISDANAQNTPQVVTVNLNIYPFRDALYVPSEYPTIQAGIDAAVNGDAVMVAEGTYTGSGNKNLDFRGKAITVRSVDPEDSAVVAATVIDCQNSGRGFYFHSGEEANSVLAGFTIKKGSVWVKGGGIYCSESSPTIKNCVITSNQSRGSSGSADGGNAYGGGVYCESNSCLTLIDCIVSNNRAIGQNGGDLWCSPMSGCSGELGNGGGGYGGGIYGSTDSSLTIVDCIISDNSASGGKGGVYYETGEPMAGANGGRARGGGIYSGSVATIINNCGIFSNTARGGDTGLYNGGGGGGAALGGGVYDEAGAEITNCTLISNMATKGSGDYMEDSGGGGIRGTAATTITNCILWGNDDDLYGCSATYSCIEDGNAGEGNINADPCFVTGPFGDYYLSQTAAGQAVDSPCVDSGSDTAANLGMDIFTTRTDELKDKGIVDMGYHYPVSPGSPDIDGDGDVDFFDYSWLSLGLFYETSKQIPRGSVIVDGDLSDWPGSMEWRDLDEVYWGNPNDVSEARFALQWDDATDKVYAAVVVNDTDHFFLDEYVYWDASDRIEVYSQGDAENGAGWNGIYDVAQQYYVAPDTNGGSWATWARGMTLGTDVGLEYAVDVNGTQIIYEVGVRQFDNYGGFSGGETLLTELHTGHVVGFDIVACTRWDTTNFGMLSENLMAGKYRDAGKFAKYVLVDEIFSADLDGNGVRDYADLDILFENWPGCYVTKVVNPKPTNNATSVDPEVTLRWRPGGGAIDHDVYLGTDADAVANASQLSPEFMGTVSEAHFDPCGLDWATTYYWRIDEVGPGCMIQGDVWSFTTQMFDEPNFPLAGQWKFDEGAGSIAYDSAGNNDGTIYGATWTSGKFNGALSFDGANDYVDCGNDASLDPGSGPFALSAWIKTSVSNVSKMIVSHSSTVLDPVDTDFRNVWFGTDAYNHAYVFISDINLNATDVGGTTNIGDGNWHYIVAVRDENSLYLYVDGVCEGTPADATSVGDVVGPGPWSIGAINYGEGTIGNFFNGTIDEVAIYK